VKTDDGQFTIGHEAIWDAAQREFQRPKLIVDRDPQGLKRACGRVDAAVSGSWNATANQVGQLARCTDSLSAAPGYDLPRDAPTEPFFTIPVNNTGQMICTKSLQEPPGRLTSVNVETQIDRAVRVETETALPVGQLVAGQPEVKQHAMHLLDLRSGQHLRQIAVVRLN
jgi:hypothetical protein